MVGSTERTTSNMKNKSDDMANFDHKEILIGALKNLVAAVMGFLLLFIVCILCGCKTQYVPIESVRTEFVDKTAEVHIIDSVIDTRFVYVKGDTVVAWRDRVKWREREQHDTVFIARVDTIRIPYPIERSLSRWEKVKMNYGGMAIGGTLVAIVILMIYLLRFCYLRKYQNNK